MRYLKNIFSFLLLATLLNCGSGDKEDVFSQMPQESDIKGVYSVGTGDESTLNSLLANQSVDGLTLLEKISWKDIEPSEGSFNWEGIDPIITKARTYKKKIMLRIVAGTYTPDWVYAAGAQKFEFIDLNPNHATYGQTMYMPLPWDEVYLEKWADFIKTFGERYNNEPLVTIIQMTGGGWGGEMHLPEKTNETLWLSYGYSEEKLINAWKIIIDSYAGAFPNKQIAIDIATPVHFGDDPFQIVEDVVAYGYQKAGSQFSVQGNWLAANTQDDFPEYALIKSYSSKTSVGFQMIWSYTQDNGQRLGGTLRDSIQRGLDAGAKYLEIFLVDIQNSNLQTDIQYAHEQLNK